jgi:hypothetical protein
LSIKEHHVAGGNMNKKDILLSKEELINVTAGDLGIEPGVVYCAYAKTCPYFDPRLCIVSGGPIEERVALKSCAK